VSIKVVLVSVLVYGALIAAIAAEDGKCLACGESIQGEATITNYTLSAYADILPGVCPKAFNITGQGLLPIAVLGTNDFDVSTIDPSTINLMREGSAGKIALFRWHYGDVAGPSVRDEKEPCRCQIAGADGYTDLILEFDIYMIVKLLDLQKIAGENIVLNLTGDLRGNANTQGSSFGGSDCISLSGVS